eukprot:Hpha_TRINITY_DN8550_c0_g2::TRINITY_DN8550_c0_g2_i1::g.146281::m.146281
MQTVEGLQRLADAPRVRDAARALLNLDMRAIGFEGSRHRGSQPDLAILELLLFLAFDAPASIAGPLRAQGGKRKRSEWTAQNAKRFRRRTRRARANTLIQEGKIEEKDNCGVCLDQLHQDGVFLRCIASCGHTFHDKCLGQWVRANDAHNCPLCRHQFL